MLIGGSVINQSRRRRSGLRVLGTVYRCGEQAGWIIFNLTPFCLLHKMILFFFFFNLSCSYFD